jgi:hypothetical protein
MRFAPALWMSFAASVSAGTVADSSMGYAITLPATWSQVKAKTEQHYFRDSTRHYHSQISIVRYDIDKETYPTPESWSQAQFIAYKVSVETSVYPFGAIGYYDSSSKATLGGIWSPEAFSVLYPADGDPTYCEFIRYCAIGNSGYEIYAIGDSTDMAHNVDFYADVIATLRFTPSASIGRPRGEVQSIGGRTLSEAREFDPIGRAVRTSGTAPPGMTRKATRTWRRPSS